MQCRINALNHTVHSQLKQCMDVDGLKCIAHTWTMLCYSFNLAVNRAVSLFQRRHGRSCNLPPSTRLSLAARATPLSPNQHRTCEFQRRFTAHFLPTNLQSNILPNPGNPNPTSSLFFQCDFTPRYRPGRAKTAAGRLQWPAPPLRPGATVAGRIRILQRCCRPSDCKLRHWCDTS